jgi:hypothetical protein
LDNFIYGYEITDFVEEDPIEEDAEIAGPSTSEAANPNTEMAQLSLQFLNKLRLENQQRQ